MLEGSHTWIGVVLAVGLAVVGGSPTRAEQSSRGGDNDLLLLVTEKLERPSSDRTETRYWWSNPKNPQWTATDRALKQALADTDAAAMTPPGDVRVSRIYRTPDLSLDNAASLASILGARRIVLGEVTYQPTTAGILPGYDGLRVEGKLQVVDVTTSEPSVIRSLEVRRSVFAPGDGSGNSVDKEGASDDRRPIARRARRRFAGVVGTLLDRTVVAASGEVGVETEEPLLALHDLKRGGALRAVREFLAGLDTVDDTRVRWASEGRIAVEINPSKADDVDAVRYAARTLTKHDFDRLSVRRMKKAETGPSQIALAVELADNFDEPRRRDEEPKDNE